METDNGKYAHLIDECSRGKTSSGEKTVRNVRIIIPVLISWAKKGKTDATYGDLIKALGYRQFSGIGSVLGTIHTIMDHLSKATGHEIPTLNALVTDSKTGLPSDGFLFVKSGYNHLSQEDKENLVKGLNTKAILWPNWDWVLNLLGLKPAEDLKAIDAIRKGHFGFGGEGPEHKALKEYVASHPESIGLPKNAEAETEHILLSGDRLDVFFPKENVAVEIKSHISDDADILRGIFQCVKYKSILDAEAAYQGTLTNGRVMLVLGGTLPGAHHHTKDTLGVTVIDNLKF